MLPDANTLHPLADFENLIYAKPSITNPNIIVGDFTYITDSDFESHVLHHYDFIGDKLIIGKFCQIGAGVRFIMNGANHRMNCISTFPFYIFNGWKEYAESPSLSDLPLKGDTVIANDVWIGENATILPGVHIGNGAIIGMNSTVGSNIDSYSIAVGDPARVIRRRFDDEMISLLEKLCWWDKSIDEILNLIPILTCSDTEHVKNEIKIYLGML